MRIATSFSPVKPRWMASGRNSACGQTLEEILPYLEEKTGTIGVPEEELTVSHGGKYRIYYFDRKLDLQE